MSSASPLADLSSPDGSAARAARRLACAGSISSSLVMAILLSAATAAFLADKSLSFALLDRSRRRGDQRADRSRRGQSGRAGARAVPRGRPAGRPVPERAPSCSSPGSRCSTCRRDLLKVEDDFGLSLGSRPRAAADCTCRACRCSSSAALFALGGRRRCAVRGQGAAARRTLLVPSVAMSIVRVVLYLIREDHGFDTLLPPFIGPIGIRRLIGNRRFAGAMPDVTTSPSASRRSAQRLFLVGVLALSPLVPARRPGRRRLPRRGDAHRRLRRDPLLLLPGRLRPASSRPARRCALPSSSSCCGHQRRIALRPARAAQRLRRRSTDCACPRPSARRSRSARVSRASCTTAWPRTCGSPSSSTNGSCRYVPG